MDEYTVLQVTEQRELDALVEVVWKAQYRPYMPSISMHSPIIGFAAEDRERALTAAKERLWKQHINGGGESSGWVYVKHRDKVIAGAQWEVHGVSPFKNGCPRLNLHWLPAGELMEFCQEMFQQAYTPRSLWMQHPHGGINMMAVLPEHRGRGVGGLIMRWTNRLFDEKGLESFLEASDLGRNCYERNGYTVAMKLDFYIPAHKKDNDEWLSFAHDLMPPPWYAMWRPAKGGPDPRGKTKPWQLGTVLAT